MYKKLDTYFPLYLHLKVTFNASKTKDLFFSEKYLTNSPPLTFNNIYIERINLQTDLGMFLSSSFIGQKKCMRFASKETICT